MEVCQFRQIFLAQVPFEPELAHTLSKLRERITLHAPFVCDVLTLSVKVAICTHGEGFEGLGRQTRRKMPLRYHDLCDLGGGTGKPIVVA